MIEYAPLRSRIGIPSWRGCLYYAQRLTVHPPVRRAAARVIATAINMRQRRPQTGLPEAAAAALARMSRDGYAMLPDMLSAEQIGDILAYLGHRPLTLRDGRQVTAAQAAEEVTIADADLDTVLDCPHVLALANSPLLIGLAAEYLGCMPTISTIGIRWSFPGQGTAIQTQHFHRDPDDWRFFKFFLYLSDVDPDCGPHVYVKGTHRHAGSIRSRRFDLAELEKQYGRDAIVSVTGPRGTCFVADTYGIHAGPVPLGRPRLMLEAGYSILPVFAFRYHPRRMETGHDLHRYVNRLLVH